MSEGLGIARLRRPLRTAPRARTPQRLESQSQRGLTREQLGQRSIYVRRLIRLIDSHKLCKCCREPFMPATERERYCGRCGGVRRRNA